MINVYIETSVHAECVATIQDEWVYMALLPAFEKLALEWGGILTESVFEDTKTHRNDADLSDAELDEMILAVGNAQHQLEIEYNSELESRDGIIWNLEQLSKVELLLRNLKS
jgi:hypothetical protein